MCREGANQSINNNNDTMWSDLLIVFKYLLTCTEYTNSTVHFLFYFSCFLDTEGDTYNPIWWVFCKVCEVIYVKFG